MEDKVSERIDAIYVTVRKTLVFGWLERFEGEERASIWIDTEKHPHFKNGGEMGVVDIFKPYLLQPRTDMHN